MHKLPTPYQDDLFRAIHAEPGIDLQVFHLWKGSDRRPWKSLLGTGYPNHYMNVRLGVDARSLKAALTDRHSLFMVGDWAHLPSILLYLARRLVRSPVAVWTDTPQEDLHRPFPKKQLRSGFLSWLLRNVDLILASGQPAANALIEMGAPPEKLIDFQFVVDLDRPKRRKNDPEVKKRAAALRQQVGCQNEGVVFSMSGTLDLAKKAQDLGLMAFASCARQLNKPSGLLIAGAGEGEPVLQEMVKNLGLEDRVALLGWQEPVQMDSVYCATDVLFHPAHYDPFPLVVLEAMSWGKPVVGSDACGSVQERVRDGINGFSFRAGDESDATRALFSLTKDSDTLENASVAARESSESWPISRAVAIIKSAIGTVLT